MLFNGGFRIKPTVVVAIWWLLAVSKCDSHPKPISKLYNSSNKQQVGRKERKWTEMEVVRELPAGKDQEPVAGILTSSPENANQAPGLLTPVPFS